jgi:hypothetical protein
MGVQEIQGGSWFGSFCVVLSKLHIGAATLNPNFPNYRNRVIVKPLVFLIRQCPCRSHSNRIPGVNSHRVDILNGAMGVVMVEDVSLFLQRRPALQAFGGFFRFPLRSGCGCLCI